MPARNAAVILLVILAFSIVTPAPMDYSANFAAYEEKQASKLKNASASMLKYIRVFDNGAFKMIMRRFAKGTAERAYIASPVLVIGARLGGEVRAFQELPEVSLAIGLDVAPGEKNPYVLYGDAHQLVQFKNHSFGSVYTNVLDHVLYINLFAAATHRVLRPAGTLFVDLNHQSSADDSFAVHDLIAERAQIVATIKAAGFNEVHADDVRYPYSRGRGKGILRVSSILTSSEKISLVCDMT
jgi:SAM-dependent methyltransferase